MGVPVIPVCTTSETGRKENIIITSRVSGRGYRNVAVFMCVCLCVGILTPELFDISSWNLVNIGQWCGIMLLCDVMWRHDMTSWRHLTSQHDMPSQNNSVTASRPREVQQHFSVFFPARIGILILTSLSGKGSLQMSFKNLCPRKSYKYFSDWDYRP